MVFNTNISIDIEKPDLNSITDGFQKIIGMLLYEFCNKILLGFAEHYMSMTTKPFQCEKCGNCKDFTWKTRHGKVTKILLIFGVVNIRQLQIKCSCCNHKFYITRHLLEMSPRKKIPLQTVKKLGLLGALVSYRVAQKIVCMFGWQLDKMTIWRSVQKLGKQLQFGLDPDEKACGEADGTGIPIQGIKKRGRELKVLVQLKNSGGVRIAGLSIGRYETEWNKLFNPLLPAIGAFRNFLLVTDGDTSIFKVLKSKASVVLQRCLWHIPHQMKWYLWKDGVKSKSKEWFYAMSRILDIVTADSPSLQTSEDETHRIVKKRRKRIVRLIEFCREKEWNRCVAYLENALPDIFTAIENRWHEKTTSHAERVMRTVNLRINTGKWSESGALHAMKIRLAYYYNNFDA